MPKVTQNSFRQNLYSTCMYMPLFDAAQLCDTRICKFLPASLRSVAKLGGTGASSTGSKIRWAAASEQAGLSKERNAQDIPRLKQYEAINANPPFRIEQNHSLHFFALLCNLCHNLCLNRTRSLHREPLHHPLPRLCSSRRLWPKEVVQWLLTMSQLPPGCHTVSQFHEILSLTSFNIWRWAIQRSPFKISLMFKVVFQNSRAAWPKTCCFHLHFMMMTANWTFLIYQPAFVGVKQRVFASNSPEPFRHSQRKWGRSSTFHWAVVPAGTKRYPTMGWPRQVMDFTMGRLRRTR